MSNSDMDDKSAISFVGVISPLFYHILSIKIG